MRLGVRLSLLLTAAILLTFLLFGWISERRSRELLGEELARAGRSVALVAQIALEDYSRDHRIDDARELADRITGYERIIGMRLFQKDGSLIYQSFPPAGAPPTDPGEVEEVLRTGRPSETRASVSDQPLVSYIFPIPGADSRPSGAVQMIQLESFLDEAAAASRRYFMTLTVVVTLATVGLVLLITHWSVTRPIGDLVTSFNLVGEGDLATRIPTRRRDEIGHLAQEFNRMCERLDVSQRALLEEQEERHRAETSLRRSERLASVGRLAAALAHEIGTPLNVIGGRAESLLRKVEGRPEVQHSLGIIIAQIDRITRIMRGMLDFARAREPHTAPMDVGSVVSRVLELVEIQMEHRRVHAEVDLQPGLPLIPGDADQLHQVFFNLVTNALDAMPAGGTLAITARAHDGFVHVTVTDTGTGIARENLGRIFDPFFTTKDVGAGTGLGLSVAYGIIREHGGSIDVESEVGRGTSVSVRLPLIPSREPVPS